MTTQFICGTEHRRQRIREKTFDQKWLNGIDYLEVVDGNSPAAYPAQQTLVLKLFQPVPATLDVDDISISGGVRFTNIGIVWAQRLVDMSLAADEDAYFAARFPTTDDRERVLVVRTDSYGDFSEYTLALALGAIDGFDPKLSSVDFSFKVECPQVFDCEAITDCPPAVIPAPAIDYLAKDYGSFRRVLLDRLSVLSPQWAERNPADVGMVVTELLAFAADQLSYYQDAVATEAYLGTARRRVSVRRHARLLDYHMHEGANARALVCVRIADDVGPGGVLLPRKNLDGSMTMFMTPVGTDPLLPADPTLLSTLLATVKPRIFEPMHDTLLFAPHNEIKFYTWDDQECCLPKGATAATLCDNTASDQRLLLMEGDILIFEEVVGRDPTGQGGPDKTRRQAVRLTKVAPSATRAKDNPTEPRQPGELALDPLTGQAVVEIEWHADDALAMPFCISTKSATDVSVVLGNVVLVDHGRTIVEPLSPATFDDPDRYRPQLAKPDVTHAVPLVDPMSPDVAIVSTLAQDPHAAVPSVSLDGGIEPWKAIPDLLRSNKFARELVVEMDEGNYATLRFGDDVLGKHPESGLVATYRIGRGVAGNVGAEAILHVMTSATEIVDVRNPMPAVGGVDPEPIEDVKHYAPQAFRVQERAVTEDDYATCAMRHPDVRRAVATRRWTGSWYTVFLTVERAYGRPIDDAFRDDIIAFVESFRLAGEDLEVSGPIFVPLELCLVVCCQPGFFRDDVERALLRVFSTATQVDGSPAFFAPDQFTFGQPVYVSEVVAAAMKVPGVDWVDMRDDDVVFRRAYDATSNDVDQGYIAMSRLEIAQCDNSPNAPENGRISFVMMGGQ